MLNTKNPLVCLPMNGVSDIRLAIAVAKSGCLPSLFLYNHAYNKPTCTIVEDIQTYHDEIGNCNMILALDEHTFMTHMKATIKVILDYNVRYVEFIDWFPTDIARFFGRKNINVGCKVFNLDIHKHVLDIVSFLIVKGNKAAGFIHDETLPLVQTLIQYRLHYPHLQLIGAGGIGSYQDIQEVLPFCDAVGIGTLFAMSEESCVSTSAKEFAIRHSCITNIEREKIKGRLNGIIIPPTKYSDETRNLIKGVNGIGGHLFAGEGLKCVSSILSVEHIVQQLLPNTRFI